MSKKTQLSERKKRLSVRIKPELKEFLTAESTRRGKTLTLYLSDLIDYHASGRHAEFKNSLGKAQSKVLLLEAEVRVLSRLLDGQH